MKAEMRALAHDLAKDSIVTDALAQFIAQVIEELHKTKIAPAKARALAAEAERDALREALAAEREACAAFVEAEAKHLPGGVCDMKATCRYLANEIRARALTMETNDG